MARGLSEVVQKPDVIMVGNGRRLMYGRGGPTPAREVNQKEIKFTEVCKTFLSSDHRFTHKLHIPHHEPDWPSVKLLVNLSLG